MKKDLLLMSGLLLFTYQVLPSPCYSDANGSDNRAQFYLATDDNTPGAGAPRTIYVPPVYLPRQRIYLPPRIYKLPPVGVPPVQTPGSPPVYSPPRRPTRRYQAPSLPRDVRPPPPARWSGKCVKLIDSDMIKVTLHKGSETIRLYGIDCPEKAQAYGTRATQFTSSAALGKTVTIYSKGRDSYGRVLAWVFVGSQCLNADLVRNGLAWWHKQASPQETKLGQLEAQARSARRGLWTDTALVAPWQFRRAR